MKRIVVLRPRALADVEELAWWIAQDSPDAADAFPDLVFSTIDAIVEHPGAGATCQFIDERLSGLRRRPVRRYRSHFIYYRYDDRTLVVLRVLHAARDTTAVFLEEFE